jgi:hypothetical protein
LVEDSPPKGGVILDNPDVSSGKGRNWPPKDEPASYQLVGRVIAYQGDDG